MGSQGKDVIHLLLYQLCMEANTIFKWNIIVPALLNFKRVGTNSKFA